MDARLDPIVNPGHISPHVHVITGGNAFAGDMDFGMARNSTCSSCNIVEDMSNYWTPKMYFKAKNGSFIEVHISGDQPWGFKGGMAIYYKYDSSHDGLSLSHTHMMECLY
jgi:hypothetical protein